MKKIILLLTFFHTAAYADNIIEIYSDFAKGRKSEFKIIKQNGKYGTLEICEDFTPIKVDLKNGYIRIDDDCPGGGLNLTEIGLFRDKAGGPTLAINSVSIWEGRVEKTSLKIYKKTEAGKWIEIDLPNKPNAELFGLTMPKKIHAHFPILFIASIPVKGTDLHVYLQAGGVSAIKSKYRFATDEESETEWKNGFKNASPKYDELVYGWNSEQGLFYLKNHCKASTCTPKQ